MALFEWLWLFSPFLVIGAIALEPRLLKLVGRHHTVCRRAGWCGLGMLLLAVCGVSGWIGQVMFLVGTPLVGLAVWRLPDDRNDGGEDAPAVVPPFDWDDFERAFRAHVRTGHRPQRPRSPSAS
jgi:hypothetical protein